jgi:dTDP-glucose 4,6-dehydratase
MKNILITGGCGFIGSNLIHYIFNQTSFDGRIINADKLTYAANPSNLLAIEESWGENRYFFEKVDICDPDAIENIYSKYEIDTVIHLAAESHVDRSILGPQEFINTNILGTMNLIEMARKYWAGKSNVRFHHVSTDEVYGSLGEEGLFTESTAYDPHSPYSASKASSDFLVRAYFHTYDFPATISNCSNNYGPFQHPEKLIPHMISRLLNRESLPVYGDGKNIRDWLFVEDHCSAIWTTLTLGRIGATYNVGGDSELQNIDLVNELCSIYAAETREDASIFKSLITFVKDRPGHDRRYAIDSTKIKSELGWKPRVTFAEGLRKTLEWYLSDNNFTSRIKDETYSKWLKENYQSRLGGPEGASAKT